MVTRRGIAAIKPHEADERLRRCPEHGRLAEAARIECTAQRRALNEPALAQHNEVVGDARRGIDAAEIHMRHARPIGHGHRNRDPMELSWLGTADFLSRRTDFGSEADRRATASCGTTTLALFAGPIDL